MTFSTLLREARVSRNLTRADVARRCIKRRLQVSGLLPNTAQVSMRHWETRNSGRLPNLSQFAALVEVLNLTEEETLEMVKSLTNPLTLCQKKLNNS